MHRISKSNYHNLQGDKLIYGHDLEQEFPNINLNLLILI